MTTRREFFKLLSAGVIAGIVPRTMGSIRETPVTVGVDLGLWANEPTTVVVRQARKIIGVHLMYRETFAGIADHVLQVAKWYSSDYIIVPTTGMGAGLFDLLRERGFQVARHSRYKTKTLREGSIGSHDHIPLLEANS